MCLTLKITRHSIYQAIPTISQAIPSQFSTIFPSISALQQLRRVKDDVKGTWGTLRTSLCYLPQFTYIGVNGVEQLSQGKLPRITDNFLQNILSFLSFLNLEFQPLVSLIYYGWMAKGETSYPYRLPNNCVDLETDICIAD